KLSICKLTNATRRNAAPDGRRQPTMAALDSLHAPAIVRATADPRGDPALSVTPQEELMKDGFRFVDSDMHIMEPPDLFDRYLDAKFKHRVSVPVGPDGRPFRGPS